MVCQGQVWFTGQRSVVVLDADDRSVTLRDSYGKRRALSAADFAGGFVATSGGRPASPVMACRALADLEPA